MKKYSFAFLTAIIAITAGFTAMAGTWKNDAKGWWYDNGDGTYPTSSLHWIDGNNDGVAECYYFDSEGYLVTNTRIQKYNHDVDQNGAMLNYDGMVMTLHISPEDNMDTISGVYSFKSGESAGEIIIPDERDMWAYVQKKDESTITVTRYGETIEFIRINEKTYDNMSGEGDIIIESDGTLTIMIASEESHYVKCS
ncbi:hypothetical protein [Oribacterium sp. FC2011]|uniref:hypothetical protein n=1 Tax=Oribacterium sp. FC2011 TaxID=1408311 RepID=UPI0004E13016|nr:hypothetical protein [Oribacterium sp. FC2011]